MYLVASVCADLGSAFWGDCRQPLSIWCWEEDLASLQIHFYCLQETSGRYSHVTGHTTIMRHETHLSWVGSCELLMIEWRQFSHRKLRDCSRYLVGNWERERSRVTLYMSTSSCTYLWGDGTVLTKSIQSSWHYHSPPTQQTNELILQLVTLSMEE